MIHDKHHEGLNKILFILFALIGICLIANPYCWLVIPDFRVFNVNFETWIICRALVYVICFVVGILGVVLVDLGFSLIGGRYYGP